MSLQAASFPKSRRLLTKTDFDRIFGLGLKVVSSRLVVIAAPTAVESAEENRLGLVVSKKVGNAIVRNRVKRLLREAFRTMDEANANQEASLDMVVIARPASAEAGLNEIKSDLRQAIEKLRKKNRSGTSN